MFGRKAFGIATASIFGVGLLGGAAVAALAPAPADTAALHGLAESTTAKGPKPGSPDRIKAILDALVAKNVITQAQEDAILAALKDATSKDDKSKKDRGDALERIFSGLFEQSATYLGIAPADLKAKLPGTSLGAIADATPGKTRTGLVATLSNASNAAIDKALAEKKVTQEQADKAKAAVPDRIAKFVDQTYPARVERKPAAPKAPSVESFLGDVGAVARDYLGLPNEDVSAALRSGKSLGEIATSTSGKSRQGLIDAITALTNAKIDKAVQDKKITADQATKLKAGVTNAVTRLVDRKGSAAKVRH